MKDLKSQTDLLYNSKVSSKGKVYAKTGHQSVRLYVGM